MDRAVVDLADRRFVRTLDPPAQLHLLASLVAQGEHWIAEQVAAAREAGASWSMIGRLLGVTATVARQRYATTTPAPRAGRLSDRHAHRARRPLPPTYTKGAAHHRFQQLTIDRHLVTHRGSQ